MVRAAAWLVVLACAGTVSGFGTLPTATTPRETLASLSAAKSPDLVSRESFLWTSIAAAAGAAMPASAKEIDPALKGTKKDPAYEACVSACLYDCTKPKGSEQKSRQECIPECKKKCATTKQQLMIGDPIKKD